VTVPGSDIVLIGASGAISGILGAYVILFPKTRILSLIFLFIFIRLVYIPAWVFIGIWFVYQLLYGILSIGATAGGVAFLAHIGGFVTGLGIALLFRKRLKRRIRADVEAF
jgi:membrane associated rhomboid family serine protease